MARIHGKDANFSYNAVALEGALTRIVMTADVPEAPITAFAGAWQVFLAGKKNVKTELEGLFDPASGAIDAILFAGIGAGVKSTVFDPTGSGPGANNPTYNCTASGLTGALVASYHISLPVTGPATIAAVLQHSGSTSRAVA